MELVVIIVLIILSILVISNTSNKRNKNKYKPKTYIEAKPSLSSSSNIKKENVVNCIKCNADNTRYIARFDNGVVYRVCDDGREYVIGYYEQEDGKWKVKCVCDRGEIATISLSTSSAYIMLNRLGDLKRYRQTLKEIGETQPWLTEEEQNRQYALATKKTQLTWMCAETFKGFVQDVQTYETVATSDSNDLIGVSAAFACLHYEVVMDSKYHSFYKAII